MDDNRNEERRVFGEIEEIEDEVEGRFKQFKNVDTLAYPPYDHRFIDKIRHIDTESTLAERIQKELEVLKTRLPSSIFVRVYENLMRAAISGLEGTPYCHGLFFFDIIFPKSYPARAPKIFFHYTEFAFNPRLSSSDGRLLLNLLIPNRWYRLNFHKEQMWNPEQSDILQVLDTIQKQVLIGSYDQVMLIQSKRSNKEIFMLNCEAMVHTLQFPPQYFEDLVRGHFRNRAHQILLIYKNQMNSDNTDVTMKQLFLKLLNAFEENGAYCGHHLHAALEEDKSSGHPQDKSENTGLALKFIYKFNNLFQG